MKISVNDSIINNYYLKIGKGFDITSKIELSKEIIDFLLLLNAIDPIKYWLEYIKS